MPAPPAKARRTSCPPVNGRRWRKPCAPELQEFVRALGPWWFLQPAEAIPPLATKFDRHFDGDAALTPGGTLELIKVTIPKGTVGLLLKIGRDYRFQNLLPDAAPPTWTLQHNGRAVLTTDKLFGNPFFTDAAERIPLAHCEPCPLWLTGGDTLVLSVKGHAAEPGSRSVNARLFGWHAPAEYFAPACAPTGSPHTR